MKSTLLVGFLIASTVCAAHQATAPTVTSRRAPKVPPRPMFLCPDSEAQQGCKSYQELVKAKDKSLPSEGYFCFRKKEDEFFAITFNKPYFTKHLDPDTKEMVPDDKPRMGTGYAQTYRNGVLDSSRMPSFTFTGKWKPVLWSDVGIFISDTFNFKKQDENDKDSGVSIDDTQVNVEFKYKNPMGKDIHYVLTIQRSTGRYSESFRDEDEKVPFRDSTGYCISR